MDSPLDKGGADRRGDLTTFNAYLLKEHGRKSKFIGLFKYQDLQ